MSFSADWLSLREPADRAARDDVLLHRAAAAAGPAPVILDLGCGSGSTVRTMAPYLPEGTRWRLVDNDPELLDLAKAAAGPRAETFCTDIADLDALPLDGVTLVTASALFDLVPETWVRDLASRLGVPLYAALSYDGAMRWTLEDPRDAAVTDAFNRHQRGDKGLGPALGPDAVTRSVAVLRDAGFEVSQADSRWRLGPDAAPLQRMLVEGIARAAGEAGMPEADDWGALRIERSTETTCLIGHGDILAVPRGTPKEERHALR
ncbi:hypothetical protein ROJ8625_04011 [Roseivivax jejudonensis]|uniref:Methyltransferase domain-containing protein n=1 Tax=Roseivivax jejudonensis TaxID=1529041 RepID=A0A1X7ACD0_9RHOB|nr:class I SAM-dependent methyltransferase [Roseivivax jejudonensis]SLN74111.1 hypothetical protein ROJ8625_04011 [Roseivivax jejudonensis]